MWTEHKFEEHGVRIGLGTAFCYMNTHNNETKYHILGAVESMPEVTGEVSNIEYSTTTNPTTSNVPGKKSLNNPEISFPYNLDMIYKLRELKGKELQFAYIDLDDFSGQEFAGKLDYRVGEISTEGVKVIVVSITTTRINDDISTDLYDLYQDTIRFKGGIPTSVVLSLSEKDSNGTSTKTAVLPVETVQASTLSATSDTTGVCTVSLTGGKLTITSVAAGSADVKISAVAGTGVDLAGNDRYIKVIVTA